MTPKPPQAASPPARFSSELSFSFLLGISAIWLFEHLGPLNRSVSGSTGTHPSWCAVVDLHPSSDVRGAEDRRSFEGLIKAMRLASTATPVPVEVSQTEMRVGG